MTTTQSTGDTKHEPQNTTNLVRSIGPFDATMIVMGGIIGSGIFMNPSVVARHVHTPMLILGAWLFGGFIALAGAFIYAELAVRRQSAGGQYVYLRDAFHPAVAFVFGWSLLLVSHTGGMAAVAMTFSRYFINLTQLPLSDGALAAITLAILTIINCLGVKQGSRVQSVLMILKIMAIAVLILAGYFLTGKTNNLQQVPAEEPFSFDLLTSFGAAMVPVLFAFGGWQTASFIAGEVKESKKNLPRAILTGVFGVIILYLGVNFISIMALGPEGLATTTTPASEVMQLVLGTQGANFIACGIAISTLGFLSQSILTAPRVYFAMAQDGLFFKKVASVHPRTRVPVIAIILQGVFAIIIALSGTYEQILSYVVCSDFIFFGLTACSIFVFRRMSANALTEKQHNIPGHPATTIIFITISALVVINTIYTYPVNTLIGLSIILTGIPVYYVWAGKKTKL